MEEEGISKCKKTLSGQHLWEPLGRADTKYEKCMICVACGFVNDKPVDKVN